MFVERQVSSSALFTLLVGWHASAVSLPPSDAFLAELACPLNEVIVLFTSGITSLSLYKHWNKGRLRQKPIGQPSAWSRKHFTAQLTAQDH
jgi:hypothetical protein